MKKLTITALLAAQLVSAASPVLAAGVTGSRDPQMGAFAGLRLRVGLDGDALQRPVRAGFAVAPIAHSRTLQGESHVGIGEGVELDFSGRHPVRLLLAGQDISRLGAAQQDEEEGGDRSGGPSTLGWIAIGIGALVVGVVAAAAICASDNDCIPSE